MSSTYVLPTELGRVGFSMGAVCRLDSPLAKDKHVRDIRFFGHGSTLEGLLDATDDLASRLDADLIIPCDEGAISVLGAVRERLMDDVLKSVRLPRLLSACLGEMDAPLPRRSAMVEALGAQGSRVPRQVTATPGVTTASDLAALGRPLVVKADNTCGGGGVRIASSPEEALALVERIVQREGDIVGDHVAVQEFISGTSLSVSFSVFEGRLRAAFAYRIVRRDEPFGAAIDIAVIDRPDLIKIAARVAGRFPFTGFGGIDFIEPDGGGVPVFLEMNVRPVRTTHMGRQIGVDLCLALAASWPV